jgi:hypothetical protein
VCLAGKENKLSAESSPFNHPLDAALLVPTHERG